MIIDRLWKVLNQVVDREKRRERRMVGKRMILVLMEVVIELTIFHPHVFIQMAASLRNTEHWAAFRKHDNMSLSAQVISKQLKEMIQDKKNTNECTTEAEEQLEGRVAVLNWENPCTVLNMVLNTINDDFAHQCLDQPVLLLNSHRTWQSPDDHVPDCKYCIPRLPGTKVWPPKV